MSQTWQHDIPDLELWSPCSIRRLLPLIYQSDRSDPGPQAAQLRQTTLSVMVCHVKVLPRVTCDLTLIYMCDQKQVFRGSSHADISGTHFSLCLNLAVRCGRETADSAVVATAERRSIALPTVDLPFYIHTQMRA